LQQLEGVVRSFLGRRCRDEAELDDAVQETFLRAARFRERLHDPARLRGWTLRIAANVVNDRVRRELRLPRADVPGGDLDLVASWCAEPGWGSDAVTLDDAVVDRERALVHLARALMRMRPRDRALLRSYYGGGRDGRETARECALSHELVKVRLFRARRRLRRELRRSLRIAEPAGASERPPC
jgi:RNA polymerase sigma-70 factor (ECF subfamily)